MSSWSGGVLLWSFAVFRAFPLLLLCTLYWAPYHSFLLGAPGPPFPLLWVQSFPGLVLLWLNTLHQSEAIITLLVEAENQKSHEKKGKEGGVEFPTRAETQPPQKAQSAFPGPSPEQGSASLWPVVCKGATGWPGYAAFAESRASFVVGISPHPLNMPGGNHSVRNHD